MFNRILKLFVILSCIAFVLGVLAAFGMIAYFAAGWWGVGTAMWFSAFIVALCIVG